MADKMLNSFDVWITAQGVKSRTRLRSVDNISLVGVKRLRELILDLAIMGRLVKQDASEEPASKTIERINVLRTKLLKEKKIREEKKLPKLAKVPFQIPSSWHWCYLNDLGIISSSSRVHQKDWQASGIPFYRAREIVKLSQYGYVDNDLFISQELYYKLKEKSIVPEENDIMITGVGTIGIPYVVKKDDLFYFKDASVLIFKNVFKLYPDYLKLFFTSKFWDTEIHKDSMGTTVDTLTIVRAKVVPIPLPPPEEQHRIVAKVDELMALCDALEHQETHHLKSHQLLVETLLGTLTRAADANEFQHAWNKLYKHFDDLFTTEDSIDQLKQTILQLAVMGKLVPQDPNDEPASELLKKIAKERESLLEEGKIKRQKQPLEIKKHEMSFEIPKDWSWCRLNDIVRFSGGGTPSMSRNEYWGGEIPWISPKDMSDKYVSNSEMKITKEGVENSTAKMIPRGSLLVVARSGILKRRLPVAINMVDCTVNQDIKVLIPYNPEINKYLLLMFSGLEKFILENYVKIGTTVHSLKYESFEIMPVPIPPIKEQHRIIAKVDELFALCDRLKGRIAEAQKVANQIAEGVVGAVLD